MGNLLSVLPPYSKKIYLKQGKCNNLHIATIKESGNIKASRHTNMLLTTLDQKYPFERLLISQLASVARPFGHV